MKDTIDRLFAFGFGLAIASKEQAEKFVDELVEKGKVAKEESSSAVEELIKKGKNIRKMGSRLESKYS